MYDSHYRIDCGRSAGFNIGNGRWTSYAWVRLQKPFPINSTSKWMQPTKGA